MEIVNLNHVTPEGTAVDFKKERTLEKLYKLMKQKQIVKVKIDQVRKAETTYVWKVEFDGINGIIQFEDSGLEHKNQMQQFVGQEVFVQIKKVKRNPAYVIADRSSALQILKDQLFEQLNEGKVINSVVKGIGNNEVYVDIGGGHTVGMDRKEATLSSARKSLRRYFDIGQHVKVKVLSIDKKMQQVKISHVATLKDPWDLYKFTRNDVVAAEVVNVTSNKVVFAEVEPGLDAIVTIPDIPIELNIGDKIQASVTKFMPEERKFRLRFKNKIEV
jgi:small subunit ribosomal protein S1